MLKKQWLLAALATMALAMSRPAALAKKHRISAEEAAFIANSVVQGRVVKSAKVVAIMKSMWMPKPGG